MYKMIGQEIKVSHIAIGTPNDQWAIVLGIEGGKIKIKLPGTDEEAIVFPSEIRGWRLSNSPKYSLSIEFTVDKVCTQFNT